MTSHGIEDCLSIRFHAKMGKQLTERKSTEKLPQPLSALGIKRLLVHARRHPDAPECITMSLHD